MDGQYALSATSDTVKGNLRKGKKVYTVHQPFNALCPPCTESGHPATYNFDMPAPDVCEELRQQSTATSNGTFTPGQQQPALPPDLIDKLVPRELFPGAEPIRHQHATRFEQWLRDVLPKAPFTLSATAVDYATTYYRAVFDVAAPQRAEQDEQQRRLFAEFVARDVLAYMIRTAEQEAEYAKQKRTQIQEPTDSDLATTEDPLVVFDAIYGR